VNIVDNVSIATTSGNIHGNVNIINSEVKNGSSATVANGTIVNASYTTKNNTNYFNSTNPTISTDGLLYNYDSATNTYTSISDYVSTVFVGTVDNNGTFNGTLLINDNATGNKFQPFDNNTIHYVLLKISENAAAYDENGNILGNKSIFIAYTFNGNDTKIANVSTKSDGSYYFDSKIWYEQTNTTFKANDNSTYRIVLTYYYGGDESHGYPILNVTSENNETTNVSTNLTINDFSEVVGAGQNLTGKLLDSNGNPIIGQYIALNLTNPVNGASKIYWATTDTSGEYQLEINLFAGEYTVKSAFTGNDLYKSANDVSGTITVKS